MGLFRTGAQPEEGRVGGVRSRWGAGPLEAIKEMQLPLMLGFCFPGARERAKCQRLGPTNHLGKGERGRGRKRRMMRTLLHKHTFPLLPLSSCPSPHEHYWRTCHVPGAMPRRSEPDIRLPPSSGLCACGLLPRLPPHAFAGFLLLGLWDLLNRHPLHRGLP